MSGRGPRIPPTRALAVALALLALPVSVVAQGGSAPPGPARELRWTVPPDWKEEPPASPMRRAQYRIAGPGGAAEGVVFYFGPGQGGDADANIGRWAGQFRGGDPPRRRDIKVGEIAVALVEISGTYVGGMGGGPAGPERPDSMLLGAVVRGPDANWFFRALGPRATLELQRAAFERMLRSIRRA
jgi:hypothetical protein